MRLKKLLISCFLFFVSFGTIASNNCSIFTSKRGLIGRLEISHRNQRIVFLKPAWHGYL